MRRASRARKRTVQVEHQPRPAPYHRRKSRRVPGPAPGVAAACRRRARRHAQRWQVDPDSCRLRGPTQGRGLPFHHPDPEPRRREPGRGPQLRDGGHTGTDRGRIARRRTRHPLSAPSLAHPGAAPSRRYRRFARRGRPDRPSPRDRARARRVRFGACGARAMARPHQARPRASGRPWTARSRRSSKGWDGAPRSSPSPLSPAKERMHCARR